MRKTLGGWHEMDITGKPLRTDGLSTFLTQVAAYRMEYLVVTIPENPWESTF